MSISNQAELDGMKQVSEAVALTLKAMREYACEGMSTKELDEYGGRKLAEFGAKSAPKETYNFPGYTCISVNEAIAHGIPSSKVVLRSGDLVNIDVSAEYNGFWSDNGGSFVLGDDVNNHQQLVDASRRILMGALARIKGGSKISDTGMFIETQARKSGYKVIRNLTGHGVGRALHEEPYEIANYYDKHYKKRFQKNSVVAVETFIATRSSLAVETSDGWTFVGNNRGFVAQHEHTIMITDGEPLILTAMNGI